ncbi:proprotein convertase subtilisin/kexin type 4-like isoform X1 [Ostrea edulis]|uniref:proprotein convertase subtilisin/kexin type 4-like isoform X1 n=1 Tax=Ostrea edulis TaxID=37623 RepID=UPI0024AFA5F3|nr:proprotein convertase subtilisin/kexin type 4-like isoform X1 [Ostrea edulis]
MYLQFFALEMHGKKFVILLLLGTLFQSSEVMSLVLAGNDNEFSVQAENKEHVIDFCNGSGCTFIGQITSIYYHIKCPMTRVKAVGGERKIEEIAKKLYKIKSLEMQHLHRNYIKTTDARWKDMWALNGDVQPSMTVEAAWRKGRTGSGIVIAVVDDGVQVNHPDLMRNIDIPNSYDYRDLDSDPSPTNVSDSHGTEVSGLIAAEANNDVCIVGIAHESTIIGIRLIGSVGITDITEAKALTHHLRGVDIYSNSWGPVDGYGYKKPGPVTMSALFDGITKGRNRKGVVYVWAAGNGGLGDNCNADGYVNSVYTIPITSVGSDGAATWYAEVCAAVFAATYSGTMIKNLTSTSLFSDCVGGLKGTSFSTPQASAIVALTLQANPSLTWRDIQHLIVRTSKRYNIDDGLSVASWHRNGAGFYVSHILGFGLMNAEAMVTQAKSWTPVASQKTCSTKTNYVYRSTDPYSFYSLPTVSSSVKVTGSICAISSLEHVQVEVSFSYDDRRGDIGLTLESPSGTTSLLMTPRPKDSILTKYMSGSLTWTFTSVHFWGENVQGTWILRLSTKRSTLFHKVTLKSWNLRFYGTRTTKHTTTIPTKTSDRTHYSTTTTATRITSYSNIYDSTSRSDSGSLTAGAVAGIVVGSIIICIVIVCAWPVFRRYRNRKRDTPATNPRTGVFVMSSNDYNRFQ